MRSFEVIQGQIIPFCIVHNCRKFSAVLGTTSFRSKTTTFPSGVSRKGGCRDFATISNQQIGFFLALFEDFEDDPLSSRLLKSEFFHLIFF